MSSTLLRITLIGVWISLLAILWRGPELPAQRGDVHVLPQIVGDAHTGWMGLYMNGKKVGYSHFELASSRGGYRVEDRSVLRLRMMDQNQTVHAHTTANVDADFALQSFRVRLNSGIGQFQVNGEVGDKMLEIDVQTGANSNRHEYPIDGPLYLPSSLRARVVAAGLRAGQTLEASVFDAAAMSAQTIEIQTVGLETLETLSGKTEAWKLLESFRGVETTVWLDKNGVVLREEGPMGLVAVREDPERATEIGWGEGSLVDLMDAVAIPVHQPIKSARRLEQLELSIDGLGSLQLPTDPRQTFKDGRLRIVREDSAAAGSYSLPYRGEQWRSELSPTAFVQSDHPQLVAAAERVMAGEKDAHNGAVRLRHWVYATLEKRAVATIPNALQVLEMGAGDCNEHAVLYAGLARASGLPTRVVAGIVYSEGVFLYHAWNEVWLGEGWVSVDPAFNQMPADATHIKLVQGEPDQHIELVPLIGQLSVEVLAPTG